VNAFEINQEWQYRPDLFRFFTSNISPAVIETFFGPLLTEHVDTVHNSLLILDIRHLSRSYCKTSTTLVLSPRFSSKRDKHQELEAMAQTKCGASVVKHIAFQSHPSPTIVKIVSTTFYFSYITLLLAMCSCSRNITRDKQCARQAAAYDNLVAISPEYKQLYDLIHQENTSATDCAKFYVD
jgi:hypothetical protein